MVDYSEEYKQEMVKKFELSRLSFRKFAAKEGVPTSSLFQWKEQYGSISGESLRPDNADLWSADQKFAAVVESMSMTEIELGEFCRKQGLYPEKVKLWKRSCIEGNMKKKSSNHNETAEINKYKKKVRELERELRRKEKALAEAAALLVLRKKLNALWEDDEDE